MPKMYLVQRICEGELKRFVGLYSDEDKAKKVVDVMYQTVSIDEYDDTRYIISELEVDKLSESIREELDEYCRIKEAVLTNIKGLL